MKQTGLIYEEPRVTDWLIGAATGIAPLPRLTVGDWTEYLPDEERQGRYDPFKFDTYSCVTFSALNMVETQINWMLKNNLIPEDVVKQLWALGYMNEKGECNFSDRYTAILSGTTRQGNTITRVWDSIRKDGLLPERDFPLGGNTFEEYHDKSKITPAMKAKAKIILGLFDFRYDWAYTSQTSRTTKQAMEALKTCPLHGGIPGHAIMHFQWSADGTRQYFDTYPPFRKTQLPSEPNRFGLRGMVSLKTRRFPIHTFLDDLYVGMEGAEVVLLQQILKTLGLLSVNATGFFGQTTRQAVIDFQYAYGIKPQSGYVGQLTRKVLNDICAYDDQQGAPDTQPVLLDSLIDYIKNLFA